ncbi:MAG: hypothetical protein HOP32_06990 [Nitrospira sp.]|nr:hypothetical protein [Nitrospira sp.]
MTATDSLARVRLSIGQQKVLEGLERGRRLAIQNAKIQAALNAQWVMDLALKDLAAGGPARGRAKRVAIDLVALGVKLTQRSDHTSEESMVRSVRRILDTLSVSPIASAQNGQNFMEAAHAKQK